MTGTAPRTSIVDTNVAVVANRQSHVGPECVRSCTAALRAITESGTVAVDDGWRIIKEYRAHLNLIGQLGAGDLFFKWLLTHRTNPEKCRWVRITPKGGSDQYAEFPVTPSLSGFDPSDRKFVAVAAVVGRSAVILQATDRKWWSFRKALQTERIDVDFICEDEVTQS